MALDRAFAELNQMQRAQAVARGGDRIGNRVVANMQDPVGTYRCLAQDGLEQRLGLRAAMVARAEDPVDQIDNLVTCRDTDQAFELIALEIGVADDHHLQPAALGLAHQRDCRRERIAMPRLGSDLAVDMVLARRIVGIRQQRRIDLAQPYFARAAVIEQAGLARGCLGPDAVARFDPIEQREDVARHMRVAPQQRVETVERQHRQTTAAVQCVRQLMGQDRLHGPAFRIDDVPQRDLPIL